MPCHRYNLKESREYGEGGIFCEDGFAGVAGFEFCFLLRVNKISAFSFLKPSRNDIVGELRSEFVNTTGDGIEFGTILYRPNFGFFVIIDATDVRVLILMDNEVPFVRGKGWLIIHWKNFLQYIVGSV